jgi:hypothetical protein
MWLIKGMHEPETTKKPRYLFGSIEAVLGWCVEDGYVLFDGAVKKVSY